MLSGSKSHSFEVDWWTLGITMAELLIGHSPFLRSADENPVELEVCRRILDTEPDLTQIRLMVGTNDSAIERFIQALLIKDPAKRLGMLMLWISVYNTDIFRLLFLFWIFRSILLSFYCFSRYRPIWLSGHKIAWSFQVITIFNIVGIWHCVYFSSVVSQCHIVAKSK